MRPTFRLIRAVVLPLVTCAVGLLGVTAGPAQATSPGTAGLLVGLVASDSSPSGTALAIEDADGSALTTASSAEPAVAPAWSPDGQWIAYQNVIGGLTISHPDGSVAHSDSESGFDPVFTPDGGTLLLVCGVPPESGSLCSAPLSKLLSGSYSTTPWFTAQTGAADSRPTVSPTTGAVFFQHGSQQIWTDNGTRTPSLLIDNASQPDISRDGSTLAFVRSVGGYDQVFTQRADATGPATQRTSGEADHERPRWTLDGLALDYNLGKQTSAAPAAPVGHLLTLATGTDAVIPNGLFDVSQQPLGATLPPALPAPTTPGTGSASSFHPITPTRVLDTRAGIGTGYPIAPLAAKATYRLGFPVGKPLPAYATAAVLNVTVTQPTSAGFLTVYPDGGSAAPASSNVNWTRGETIANQVIVPIGPGGGIEFYNGSTGSVHVVADISGYFTADGSGSLYRAAGPTRLLDTRAANGVTGRTPVAAYHTVALTVAGRGTVPPTGATAAVLNVTITAPQKGGYLTAYPDGAARPSASTLNWSPGETIANHVIVPIGADGKVELYNGSPGTVHFVADLEGYFSGAAGGATLRTTGPYRLADTRQSGHPIAAHQSLVLNLASGPVPSGVSAVVLNVTVTNTRSSGYLTAFPQGAAVPTASNLNWSAGETIPNVVTLPVINGKAVFANGSAGSTDVVVDVLGYYRT